MGTFARDGKPVTIVTVVGGGVFAPRLCETLAQALDLPELELRLTARRPDRLRVLAHHSAARLGSIRPGWLVKGVQSLEAAFEEASIVILLVRVGGFEARAWDEEFPRRFGLVGDEGLGPGGIANAWRTLPELTRIAELLRCIAPGARILNLMAPLGITTRLLLDWGLETFGVCELPVTTLEGWMARAGGSMSEVTWSYGGLNHLGWFWNVRLGERDVLQSLADARTSGAPALVDRSTLDAFQAAPLRYFYEIFDREAGRRLGLERQPDRARHLDELSETLIHQFARAPGCDIPEGVRATPWLDRAVTPIVAALLTGLRYEGFVNVRNGKNIPELGSELVVEMAATFTADGASPVTPGPLPEAVSEFLGRAGDAELLTFQAAQERDLQLLEAAIRALPLPINEPDVKLLAELARSGPPAQEHR